MKRITCATLLVYLLLMAALIPRAAAQAQSLYAKCYDVDITVLTNGDMRIIERQEIVFVTGTFRQGYAVIPTDRTEGISDVNVIADGIPYIRGNGERAGTYSIENETNQVVILWGFEPASRSTHVYEIHYTVHGGLRHYPEYAEVWWKAIPPEHAYDIRHATFQIHLPPGSTILADPETGYDYAGMEPAIGTVELSEDRLGVTFTTDRIISPDEEIEIRARFEPGSVPARAPAWQAAFDEQLKWSELRPTVNLALGLVGAVLTIGGPLLVLALWYTFGRDPAVGLVADQVSSPPSSTAPGVVGTLIDEEANLQDIIATLVDLARRGYLLILEQSQGESSIASDFVFSRTEKPADDLRPHERFLIDQFFSQMGARPLSNLRHKFDSALPVLQTSLYAALVREGFVRANPEAVRGRYTLAGWVVILLALAGAIFSVVLVPSLYADRLFLLAPFMGVGISGLALIAAAPHMPHKTRKGALEAAKWRAFKRYLEQLDKYELDQARARFDEYLPYAVAFGLEKTLINKFAAVQAPLPTWYVPLSGRPLQRRLYRHASSLSGAAIPAVGVGGDLPGLQDMSDGLAGSLQSASDGLMSMFNSASKTVVSQSPSITSRSRGWSGTSSRSVFSTHRSSSLRFGGSSMRRSGGGGFRIGGGGGGGRRGFR